MCELGAALRRRRQRAEAREPLRRAFAIALGCGAAPVAERARAELAAAGGRPRVERSGVAALTPSERRIAAMAAAGMNNPEIAQALVVTLRTVETHLTHTYRKLDIGSRRELARALGGADGSPR